VNQVEVDVLKLQFLQRNIHEVNNEIFPHPNWRKLCRFVSKLKFNFGKNAKIVNPNIAFVVPNITFEITNKSSRFNLPESIHLLKTFPRICSFSYTMCQKYRYSFC
jgi:hypothetical protein